MDFLGPWLFRFGNPKFKGLDFLDSPWILPDPNRDLSMGTQDFRWKIFRDPLAPWSVRSGGPEGRRRGYAEAQKGSSRKPNPGSDFLQSIVAPAVSSEPPQPKGNSSRSNQRDRFEPKQTNSLASLRSPSRQYRSLPEGAPNGVKSTRSGRSPRKCLRLFTWCGARLAT